MDVVAWFDRYLATFVGLCRGDRDDPEALLEYYSVPLLTTGPDEASWSTSDEDVLAIVRQQMATMRAAGLDRSEMSSPRTVALTGTATWFEADFVRRRGDGSEIASFAAFYVIAELPAGRRITTLGVRP